MQLAVWREALDNSLFFFFFFFFFYFLVSDEFGIPGFSCG